jgi:crotonobetaine/carnitine-CoA ligase
VNRLANALLEWGVRKGGVVGMLMASPPEFIYTYFAAAKIGAIMVPMNTALASEELAHIVNHSEQEMLVADGRLRRVVEAARERCPKLREVIYAGKDSVGDARTLDALVAGQRETLEPTDVGPDDIASCIYTGGASRHLKGVLLDQRSYVIAAEHWLGAMKCSQNDVLLATLPLYQPSSGVYLVTGAVLYKCGLALLETFNASGFWEAVHRYGVTICNLTNSLGSVLLTQPPDERDRGHKLSRAINCGSADSAKEAFEQRFGVTMRNAYVRAECLTACIEHLGDLPSRSPNRLHSIGRPAGRVQIRLVDERGGDVHEDEIGEIWLKGPAVCRGYLKDRESTAAAIVDGWLRTGDKARRDEAGCLYLAAPLGEEN